MILCVPSVLQICLPLPSSAAKQFKLTCKVHVPLPLALLQTLKCNPVSEEARITHSVPGILIVLPDPEVPVKVVTAPPHPVAVQPWLQAVKL